MIDKTMITVTDLFYYPVKSMHGIGALSQPLTSCGFQMDRRWMVVKKGSGRFLTQRECPLLARFYASGVALSISGLLLSFEQECELIPQEQWETGERRLVTIWGETFESV